MMKNKRFSRSIADVSWYKFYSYLMYKGKWYSRTVHKIDTWFPSSKTCFYCGYVMDEMTLSKRIWDCPNCDTKNIDRDINASKNTLQQGLKELKDIAVKNNHRRDYGVSLWIISKTLLLKKAQFIESGKFLDFIIKKLSLQRKQMVSNSQAVASYICMDKLSIFQHKDLTIQIDEYITKHFSEDINANTICNHFQIGKTHLYEIVNQAYDLGVAQHIRNLRIEKAKLLLKEDTELNISEIASKCGFGNYTYFINLFKKLTGLPPKKFKDSCQNQV